ncbi:MAG: hypothetical protein QGG84_12620, partial [Rhodospirillales bacterium]|nr:hypothetical protein [Rhodospirillales bacterium]
VIYRPKKRQAGRTGKPPVSSGRKKNRGNRPDIKNYKGKATKGKSEPQFDPDSPFAKLRKLNLHGSNPP